MIACYKLKQEIRELEDYIARLERHLEVHTRRLSYLESISLGKTRLIYSVRFAKLVRGINNEVAFYRRSVTRLKEYVATLAA